LYKINEDNKKILHSGNSSIFFYKQISSDMSDACNQPLSKLTATSIVLI